MTAFHIDMNENGASTWHPEAIEDSHISCVQIRNRILDILKSVESITDGSPSSPSTNTFDNTNKSSFAEANTRRARAWQQLVDAASPTCTGREAVRRVTAIREAFTVEGFIRQTIYWLRNIEIQVSLRLLTTFACVLACLCYRWLTS